MGFRVTRFSESKFRNVRTEIDGYKFASKAEARRYQYLKARQQMGEIADLALQPKYPLVVNGERVATYIGDFLYRDARTGAVVLEDVKSQPTRTPVYRLKKKLLKALHGIDIAEVA